MHDLPYIHKNLLTISWGSGPTIQLLYMHARPYAGIFFVGGGQNYLQSRENASEGAKRPSGRRVWEGVPHEGALNSHFWAWNWTIWCTLWVDFSGKFWIKEVRRKYIFMENSITGNVNAVEWKQGPTQEFFRGGGGGKIISNRVKTQA